MALWILLMVIAAVIGASVVLKKSNDRHLKEVIAPKLLQLGVAAAALFALYFIAKVLLVSFVFIAAGVIGVLVVGTVLAALGISIPALSFLKGSSRRNLR